MSGPFARGMDEQQAEPNRRTRFEDSVSSSSLSPASPAQRIVEVPLTYPRYERKTRLNRAMTVTESASEDTGRSPAELLSMRSREALKVRQGPVSHEETITYHAFACYKHGSQVHTQSVGYSSEGDLVLMRRDIAEEADGPNSLKRSFMGVEAAVCLDPRAKPKDAQLPDGSSIAGTMWQRRYDQNRLKKYPGVRCPKNRKIRNRLINDHFASTAARTLYESAHEDSDPEGLKEPNAPTFEPVPSRLSWLVDTEEDAQRINLDKLGLDIERFATVGGGAKPRAQDKKSIDSAAFRYGQLQARMKSELQHAMSTDYMPVFIEELEARIERLILDDEMATDGAAATSIDVACRDGYGRLITHGVAAYYKLTSASTTGADGQRTTTVSLPKKRVPLPEQRLGSHLRGERAPRSPETCPQPAPRCQDSGSEEEAAQRRALARRKRFKKRVLRYRRDFHDAVPMLVATGTRNTEHA